ncbi:MAG: twin-arginine translocase TatA/TatE family subunit [Kofleriaceae bacterium]|nr:MAG: twin-arginine translocase TatA/TatE family subunit [Kofleriaceae bacterium]MBZ0231415.1 twin-arginine translocase TatA/TatE family subunit [Kofleriaceae bacterium]
MPGMGELLIILLIVMVIFGASKLPQIGQGLGSAIKNFKRAASGDDEIEVSKKKQVEGKSAKELSAGDDDDIEDAEVVSRKKAKKEA